jgi:hypothetical protein
MQEQLNLILTEMNINYVFKGSNLVRHQVQKEKLKQKK